MTTIIHTDPAEVVDALVFHLVHELEEEMPEQWASMRRRIMTMVTSTDIEEVRQAGLSIVEWSAACPWNLNDELGRLTPVTA